MSTKVRRVYGYLAEFKNASQLYKAAEKVRDAGFKKWDCYSPYPIHGLDDAMGVKRSILPYFVFIGGLTGFLTAITHGADSLRASALAKAHKEEIGGMIERRVGGNRLLAPTAAKNRRRKRRQLGRELHGLTPVGLRRDVLRRGGRGRSG